MKLNKTKLAMHQ